MHDPFAEGPRGASSSLPGEGGTALLALAVAKRLVDPGLAARLQDQTARGESETVLWSRHGPVVDALLASGLLQAGQVLALQAELAGADEVQTRMASGEDAGPSFAEARRVAETARAFPVPGWERYEAIEYLAQGGMARVFRARDPRLRRDVAIKVLNSSDGQALRRFMQEAQSQARVEHPHVCRIYEVGEVGGHPYIAMEFVHGRPIDELSQVLGLEQKVRVLQEVAEAVQAAHRLGLIHRDLKPLNILVERREEGWWPVVLDFGLAGHPDNEGLTVAGSLMGTPAFMAPEQARGETLRLDRRTDVYALGATLYALLLGRPPFQGDGVFKVLMKVMHEEPPRPRSLDPTLPEDLETILLKCLEKEPHRRYDSAKLLAEDLRRYLEGEPLLARPLGAWDRLRKRVRRNRALSAVVAVSAGAVLILGGLILRTQWRGRAQAQLAQRFGLECERAESSYRRAQMLPLHDMRPHRADMRDWMARVAGQMQRLGGIAQGPGRFALGEACLTLGEPGVALQHLEAAWRAGTQGPETAAALGLAHTMILREAREQAQRLPSREMKEARLAELNRVHLQPALHYLRLSGSSPSLVQEGQLAFLERRDPEALAKARQALARDPWEVDAHLLVARVNLARTKDLMDRGTYETAARTCDLGLAAAREAQAVARSLLEAYALEGEARTLDADLANHLGKPFDGPSQAARAALEQALKVDPEAPDVHVKLARLYRQWADATLDRGGDPEPLLEGSIHHGQEALRCDPLAWEAALLLSMTHRFRADYLDSLGEDPLPQLDQALVAGQRAIAIRPAEAVLWNSVGNCYLSRVELLQKRAQDPTADLNQASARFEEACRLDPTYASPWSNRGICLRRLAMGVDARGGDPLPLMVRAQSCYQEALKINPRNVLVQTNLGKLCKFKAEMELRRGLEPTSSLQDGAAAFGRVLAINPTYALCHGGLGELVTVRGLCQWLKGGDALPAFREALAHHRRALACNGNNAELHERLGLTCLVLARYQAARGRDPGPALEQARVAFARALEINPRSEEGLLGLAEVHLVRTPSPGALAEAARAAALARDFSPLSPAPLLVQAEIELAGAGAQAPRARQARLKAAAAALDAAERLEPRSSHRDVLRARLAVLGAGGAPASAAASAPVQAQAEARLRDALREDPVLALRYRSWLGRGGDPSLRPAPSGQRL